MARKSSTAAQQDLSPAAVLARDLAALEAKTVSELASQHLALFDEPTRSRNKRYLIKRLAWRLQEQATGGLSPRALEQIDRLAPLAPIRWQARIKTSAILVSRSGRDPRLPPPGEVLRRVYLGVEHQVKVLEKCFEYEGTTYRSLTAVAKKITGMQWNGFRFFFGAKDAVVNLAGAA